MLKDFTQRHKYWKEKFFYIIFPLYIYFLSFVSTRVSNRGNSPVFKINSHPSLPQHYYIMYSINTWSNSRHYDVPMCLSLIKYIYAWYIFVQGFNWQKLARLLHVPCVKIISLNLNFLLVAIDHFEKNILNSMFLTPVICKCICMLHLLIYCKTIIHIHVMHNT